MRLYTNHRASFSAVVLGEEDSPFVGTFLYGYSVDNPQVVDHFSTIGGIDLTCSATFSFIEVLYVENDTILISGLTNYSGGLVISAFDNPDTTISFEVVYEKVFEYVIIFV